ncbi:MAG: hypothetical protein LAQ30_05110 [Acidobacteriia bacterium]|nr:hypothetical protein [Terriglobia bacterium]
MPADPDAVFSVLKPVLAQYAKRLSVKVDSPSEYTVHTNMPSPFPRHKGQPLYFGSVRLGKAYVSLHLMPLYMCAVLTERISPALKKRMQGKTCFNFKKEPAPDLLKELKELTEAAIDLWAEKKWL